MRITSVVVALAAGFTLALTGCGGTIVPEESPNSDTAVTDQQGAPGDVTAQAICPLRWTCDWTHWYGTQTQCQTACGANPCERDYACNGTCVCP